MGVGNYRASFERNGDGVGATFILDGPYVREGAYEEYRKSETAEGMDPLPEDVWLQDESSDLWRDVVDRLKEIRIPGMETAGRDETCAFDRDFTLVASDDNVEIGYRSWENDLIVAVAPASAVHDYVEDPDGSAHEIVDSTGLDPAHFRETLSSLCDGVAELLQIRLGRNGAEVRRRTSAWTSARIEAPADPAARIAELETSVAAAAATLSGGWDAAAVAASDARRLALVAAVDAARASGEECSTSIECLYAGEEGRSLKGFDPTTGELTMEGTIPAALEADATAAVASETFALADGPALRAHMAARFAQSVERSKSSGGRSGVVLQATPEEYLKATGKAAVVVYDMGDGTTERLVLAGEDPEPSDAPRI